MIDAPLARPLNIMAVKAANQQLYQQYPHLKDLALNPSNPQHQPYMDYWREAYIESGGPFKALDASSNQKINDPIQPCDCVSPDHIVDLVFEPSSGTVYLLDANDFNALMEETRLLDDVMKPVVECKSEDKLPEEKQQAVKKLTALGINPPKSKFGGSEAGKLTEIVRLKGNKKYTYVRSEKLKDHVRSYKIKTDNKKFDYKAMAKKVREDLNKPEYKVKFSSENLLEKLDSFNDLNTFMNQYADSTETIYLAGDKNTHYNATAEAQFFRFTAGAAFHSELDPANGKLSIAMATHAELSLAEGKAKCQLLMPSPEGIHCQFELNEQPCDLGFFRLDLNLTLSGNAGASANLGAAINFEMVNNKPAIKGVSKDYKNTEKPDRFQKDRFLHEKGNVQGVQGEAGFFAGVSAGCKVNLALQWQNPEEANKFVTLAEAGESIEVAAGIGGEAYLKIEYNEKSQKFIIRFGAGLVAGIGAKGKLDAVIDGGNILKLIQLIYHQIMKTEFIRSEIIDPESFDFLQQLIAKTFIAGSDLAQEVQSSLQGMSIWWKTLNQSKHEAEQLADKILADDSFYKFSAPMIKGRFLAILCRQFLFSLESKQEQAIVKLLSYTQGISEYHEILKHTSESGEQLSPNDTLKAESILDEILDTEEQIRFDVWKHRLKKESEIGKPIIAYSEPWQIKPVDNSRIAMLQAVESRCYHEQIMA